MAVELPSADLIRPLPVLPSADLIRAKRLDGEAFAARLENEWWEEQRRVKGGFTGKKEDALGRERCYADGVMVPCEGEAKPQQPSGTPQPQPQPKQKPAEPANQTEALDQWIDAYNAYGGKWDAAEMTPKEIAAWEAAAKDPATKDKVPKPQKTPQASTDAKRRDAVDKHTAKMLIDSLLKKYPVDAREPDGSIQCHEGVAEVLKAVKESGRTDIAAAVRVHWWDETKWESVRRVFEGERPGFGNEHIENLIEDMTDGTVNGHSFISVGRHFVDPYLASLGVPQRAIDRFDSWLAAAYEKVGMRSEPVEGEHPKLLGDESKSPPQLPVKEKPEQSRLISNEYLAGLLEPQGGGATGPEKAKKLGNDVVLYKDPYGSYRFVKLVDGKPVSAIQVMSKSGKGGEVAKAYTMAEQRRKGYGRELIEAARKLLGTLTFSDDRSEEGGKFVGGVEHPTVKTSPFAKKALSWIAGPGSDLVPPPRQGGGIKLRRNRPVLFKDLPKHPKVKASFFATCERDELGHCTEGTGGESEQSPQQVEQDAIKKSANVLQRFKDAPKKLVIAAVAKARNLYDKCEQKYGKAWARTIVGVAIVTFPTPFTMGAVGATIGLAHLGTKLFGSKAMDEPIDMEKAKALAKELIDQLTKELGDVELDDTERAQIERIVGQKFLKASFVAVRKSLVWFGKSEGTCKPGQTAAQTGCTPASGEGVEKPKVKRQRSKKGYGDNIAALDLKKPPMNVLGEGDARSLVFLGLGIDEEDKYGWEHDPLGWGRMVLDKNKLDAEMGKDFVQNLIDKGWVSDNVTTTDEDGNRVKEYAITRAGKFARVMALAGIDKVEVPKTKQAVNDMVHLLDQSGQFERDMIYDYLGMDRDETNRIGRKEVLSEMLYRAYNPVPVWERIKKDRGVQKKIRKLADLENLELAKAMERFEVTKQLRAAEEESHNLWMEAKKITDQLYPESEAAKPTGEDRERLKSAMNEFGEKLDVLAHKIGELSSKKSVIKQQQRELAIRNVLKVKNPVSVQVGEFAQEHTEAEKTSVKEAQEWLSSIVAKGSNGEDLPAYSVLHDDEDRIGRGGPSAYYRSSVHGINVHSGMTNVATNVHELAHGIEYKLPGVMSAAHRFLKHRVKDQPLSKLKEVVGLGYGDWEKGRDDDFAKAFGKNSSWYCGKETRSDEDGTEIVSMGVERLFNGARSFAQQDPEYAGFILGILDGSIRDNPVPER